VCGAAGGERGGADGREWQRMALAKGCTCVVCVEIRRPHVRARVGVGPPCSNVGGFGERLPNGEGSPKLLV
jgi:hypothetical protein